MATTAEAAVTPVVKEENSNRPTTASLYVGELDPTVTEAVLFEIFNIIGPVDSIRVCRDAVTRRSLGYAYVNYHNIADGEKALETLNYTNLKGKSIRIMWSQRDPSLRKSGEGNIFIKNLDVSIDDKALFDTFSAFGNILSCKIATGDDGQSKGYGFVHFEHSEDAENAIKNVNGMLLNNKKVYVGHHIPKKERDAKIEELRSQYTNIYIKNLDESVTDDQLRSAFEKFGKITSLVIQKDDEGKSKGFGFINYEKHDEAKKAVDEMNDTDFGGKKIYVSRAQKKNEREEELKKQYEKMKEEKLNKYQGVNLYIKNLDESVTDEVLREKFSPFGTITSAKVMCDEKNDNKSRGFGFVCFSSPDEATKAVAEMNGYNLNGKQIYVALAQRKDVRKAQLEVQMNQRIQFRNMQNNQMMGNNGMYNNQQMFYGGMPHMNPGRNMYYQGMIRPHQWNGQEGYNGQHQYRRNQRNGPRRGKYNNNNQTPQNNASAQEQAAPAPVNETPAQQPTAGASGITEADLAKLSEEEQRNKLGEALYTAISKINQQYVGKITGMLLEMKTNEIITLLDNPDVLKQKVDEAVKALDEFQKSQNKAQ
ncbi:polyadenylate binding protein [Neocallimastix lanati (nom. inval.)]|jgi:polyadenylate-binding protein|uniref:Polyadenylate-binding protein n=1 Tax=Neocallimastix californiae TaxID=1754190 RepID=A0A1Y2D0I6_9FUNG|nr:polyadenylate binding protein [Neocallimastix sp. JGI-2020a]ORY52788.1 polyadenylate binding protein [Neocallimastix californiae]|eukprot:ORY52788.1 polyadenylate binding protein [Neocallimastix californiae]